MTTDDIIRMARESGMLIPSFRIGGGLALGTCAVPDFERFAGLVAQAEREACAAICDELESFWSAEKDVALLNCDVDLSNASSGEPRAARAIAQAIRARGKTDAP